MTPLTLAEVAEWLDGYARAYAGEGARFNADDCRMLAATVRRWAIVADLAVAHEADFNGACQCLYCQAVRRAMAATEATQ